MSGLRLQRYNRRNALRAKPRNPSRHSVSRCNLHVGTKGLVLGHFSGHVAMNEPTGLEPPRRRFFDPRRATIQLDRVGLFILAETLLAAPGLAQAEAVEIDRVAPTLFRSRTVPEWYCKGGRGDYTLDDIENVSLSSVRAWSFNWPWCILSEHPVLHAHVRRRERIPAWADLDQDTPISARQRDDLLMDLVSVFAECVEDLSGEHLTSCLNHDHPEHCERYQEILCSEVHAPCPTAAHPMEPPVGSIGLDLSGCLVLAKSLLEYPGLEADQWREVQESILDLRWLHRYGPLKVPLVAPDDWPEVGAGEFDPEGPDPKNVCARSFAWGWKTLMSHPVLHAHVRDVQWLPSWACLDTATPIAGRPHSPIDDLSRDLIVTFAELMKEVTGRHLPACSAGRPVRCIEFYWQALCTEFTVPKRRGRPHFREGIEDVAAIALLLVEEWDRLRQPHIWPDFLDSGKISEWPRWRKNHRQLPRPMAVKIALVEHEKLMMGRPGYKPNEMDKPSRSGADPDERFYGWRRGTTKQRREQTWYVLTDGADDRDGCLASAVLRVVRKMDEWSGLRDLHIAERTAEEDTTATKLGMLRQRIDQGEPPRSG